MPEPEPLAESIAALTHYFVGDATLGDTLHRVADQAQRAVPQATRVGVTMLVDGKVGTHVFTDPEVPEIDREQYELGDGPCLHAYRTGETVLIPSTTHHGTWRLFCAVAIEHGVMSTLSVPLLSTQGPVGALNLYALEEDAFREPDLTHARTFAGHAGFLLSNAHAYWDARSLSENLRVAMDSRAVIEQAKGIIIAATGGTAQEAFEQLRSQSQHQNIKLREVAGQIVADAQRRRRN